MNSNWILHRNQSIVMLGNQTNNIDNVNVEVNFIGVFESNAWHYKRLRGGQKCDTFCMSL
jgi:hypothetical protein